MSIFTFKLPDIGEGIAEAELVTWHVKPGDWVEEDAPLADLMTDKATVEISAPVAGRLIMQGGQAGDRIAIGSTLATLETEGEAEATETASSPHHSSIEGEPGQSDLATAAPAPEESRAPPMEKLGSDAKILASPAVRQRARNLGIELAEVKASGDGRVRHSDLDAFLTYNASAGYSPPGITRNDEHIRVAGLRRRIAENMAASKRHIPHFTYVEEVDVTKLEELRADLNTCRGAKPRLTLLPLLITAICRTLPDFPMINARFDDEEGVVTRSGAVHLGIATQTDAGLLVPVIRNAQDRNIWQLAAEIDRLAKAARAGKAKAEELSGSTLTITSLGPLGGIASTPVINRPEVAIIAPNRIVERPIIHDGEVIAAKMMNLSVSCDHRVIDGWDAASFVQALKRLLETPALIFAP